MANDQKPEILLVDDDRSFCKNLEYIYKNKYSITVVHSKRRAKEILEKKRFNLILLDLYLRKGTKSFSYELLKYIQDKGLDTPAIIVTKFKSAETTKETIVNLKATDYLIKQEINQEEWSKRFDEVIRQHTKNIFISHANIKNVSFLKQLTSTLKSFNISYFVRSEDIRLGQNIERTIDKNLQAASHILILISDSIPKWQKLEINKSLDLIQKYSNPPQVIPVLSGDQSSKDIPVGLKQLKYIDLRTDQSNEELFKLLAILIGQKKADQLKEEKRNTDQEIEKIYASINDPSLADQDKLNLWKKARAIHEKRNEADKVIEATKHITKLANHIQFEENLKKKIVLEEFQLQPGFFFKDLTWKLNPQVNVLLGKNGYGKTFLLRLMVMLAQKATDPLRILFTHLGEDKKHLAISSSIEFDGLLKMTLDQEKRQTSRGIFQFEENVGKIPLLAITDTRFIPRKKDALFTSHSKGAFKEYIVNGAESFIKQQPETERFISLVGRLGDGFFDKKYRNIPEIERFDKIPIFNLVQKVIQSLTRTEFKFSKIEELDSRHYKIMIKTPNSNYPIPIQQISRGTQSILYIFILIFLHLQELHKYRTKNEKASENIFHESSIVVIDEIDAHLHPDWQRKVVNLLRQTFPKVQFILAAHSPLIVSGCLEGEVAILRRKGENNYNIQQYEHDFIGWSIGDLMGTIYEIEERDDNYLRYSVLSRFEQEIETKISFLEEQKELTEEQQLELDTLQKDLYYLTLIQVRKKQEVTYQDLLLESNALKQQLNILKKKNSKPSNT